MARPKDFVFTEETKEKMRQARMGKKHSQETRNKISVGSYRRWAKVERPKSINRFRTQDRRLIQWRKAVFERDDYMCQIHYERGGYLEAHHIKSWAEYPELRYDVDNGITVCVLGHREIDPYRR